MATFTRTLLPLLFISLFISSCGGSQRDAELKAEMDKMKKLCPMDQGNGVIITDVNFYQDKKIMEYRCSIDGVYSIDDSMKGFMKANIIGALETGISVSETLSIKMLLAEGYKLNYIYTDVDDNVLCEILITKDDMA